MLANWTYNGWAIAPSDGVDITFPTSASEFKIETFTNYLEFSEKQIFRLILGQDSTSSADNSNRSTAAVHNLVRQDLLASDAVAVEETINTQIIAPLINANFGASTPKPKFKFKFKGVQDMLDIASLIKNLGDAGYEMDAKQISEKLGMDIKKKEVTA
jgi:phage gp29-like protein